jgi:hypothetical protein
MKHEWMTVQGLVPSDTPCNTQSAYGYEFFARLFDLTGEQRYYMLLGQIAHHTCYDFRETLRGDILSCSYSTADDRRVINANSYRMYMLLDAGHRMHKDEYVEKGLATLRYVLSKQNPDGSWPYSEDQSFVDGYHTCFVLKNLWRSRQFAGPLQADLDLAFERGSAYYFSHLIDSRGYPVPFAVSPRLTLYKYDSYDLAEAIGLLCDTGKVRQLLMPMVSFADECFRVPEGWFIFRRYKGLPVRGIPYLRYANSAMFLALTKAMKVASESSS